MAKGSMTLGGWEPKVCCLCGGKIVMSHLPALRFYWGHLNGGRKLSWHVPCEQTYGSPFDKEQVLR